MVSIIWLVAAIKQSATGVVLWGVVLLTKVAVRLATGGTSADRRVTALVDNHLLQECLVERITGELIERLASVSSVA